ncbi:MAG TPA: DUF3311 domain-containing protein [Sporichthyaceae bacterium]|nr:DUF3311 domain-containing protein [Sporichthyaceae bacterium]
MRRALKFLLLVPIVGALLPWTYNRTDPRLFDIPFFYWFQLMWLPVGVAVTALVVGGSEE